MTVHYRPTLPLGKKSLDSHSKGDNQVIKTKILGHYPWTPLLSVHVLATTKKEREKRKEKKKEKKIERKRKKKMKIKMIEGNLKESFSTQTRHL